MSTNRVRCTSRSAVEQMATANHVTPIRKSHFASVELDGLVYFWAA